MQDDIVVLVAEAAEDRALALAGVGQHGERLVGMAGQHDMVEGFDPGCAVHADLLAMPAHAAYRAI